MARITFFSASQGVTGSMYLIETGQKSILLECGLVQGSRGEEEQNEAPFPFDIGSLDVVVLSHAHLDHSGRLPRLAAEGYNGPLLMTLPTIELLEIMLKDAALIQERDAEWENKRRRRAGKKEIDPLYTEQDAEMALSLCVGIPYNQRQEIAEGIEIRFRDAGHILGSSIVEFFIREQGAEKKLVFSGDLGNSDTALMPDPEIVEDADVLLLESTYGDRNHRPMKDTLEEFENIIQSSRESGGNVLIPSFAVGRTQEVIFHLGQLYQQGKLNHQAVFLDSPMAIATTEVYHRFQNRFSTEDQAVLRRSRSKSLHAFLPVLRYTQSTQDSMALNQITEGAIIIAGSGMCNGGRIRHHLKHNLWRRNAHVVFVGYQAVGTPGRALVDGVKAIRMAGETIVVNAHIHTLGGFSAHASQSQLLSWALHFKQPRPKLFLVHGEDEAKIALQQAFKKLDWQSNILHMGESIDF